jgi:hypothetical protein
MIIANIVSVILNVSFVYLNSISKLLIFLLLVVNIATFNQLCAGTCPRGRIQMALSGIDAENKRHVGVLPDDSQPNFVQSCPMDIDMVLVETVVPPCRGTLSLYLSSLPENRYHGKHAVGRSMTVLGPKGEPIQRDIDYGHIPNLYLGHFGCAGRFKVNIYSIYIYSSASFSSFFFLIASYLLPCYALSGKTIFFCSLWHPAYIHRLGFAARHQIDLSFRYFQPFWSICKALQGALSCQIGSVCVYRRL